MFGLDRSVFLQTGYFYNINKCEAVEEKLAVVEANHGL